MANAFEELLNKQYSVCDRIKIDLGRCWGGSGFMMCMWCGEGMSDIINFHLPCFKISYEKRIIWTPKET